ncbi:hypothetical protein J3U99_21520 [Brucella pituitosa]|uniref:hypothetical protein n=1 Tax=Brucella pituitosa TaxID=571256 RepID=UPI00200645F6|nr:hypothetical protein [Brucella pituitosa]MCK4207345.1 hypothetical protein [Brucella pituitosa]
MTDTTIANGAISPNGRRGFVNNWVAGSRDTRSLRRRLMAVLRLSSMSLGMGRKRLGLGALGVGGALAVSLGFASPAFAESTLLPNGASCARPVAGSGSWTCQVPKDGGFATISNVPVGASPTDVDLAALNAWSAANLGTGAIALGNTSTSASGQNAVAIGGGAKAPGTSTVAVGTGAQANTDRSTALGNDAQAIGNESTALGTSSRAEGQSATALGKGARAQGINSTSVGENATVTADRGTAIGQGATVSHAGSIAVGANSVANGATLGNQAYLVGGSAQGEMNIGSRRLTGVAAGAADTDAVNVQQLKAITAAGQTHYFSVNDGGTTGSNYDNDGASGVNSIAVGKGASATNELGVAVGTNAKVQGLQSVAVGPSANATGNLAVAMGSSAQANSLGTTALGGGAATSALMSVWRLVDNPQGTPTHT